MKTAVETMPSAQDYDEAFRTERQRVYPVVDTFEAKCGFAIDREFLEAAARVLACPVKVNPPNWQHGRVLYAAVRQHLEGSLFEWQAHALDIGTAKGFSAICIRKALDDAGHLGAVVTSVDVLDPDAAVRRNTVAEVGGWLTLPQTLGRAGLWGGFGERIEFERAAGIDWLERHPERLHVAFVDGKHSGTVVYKEGKLLTERQSAGDLAIFDDVHIPDVSVAVNALHADYRLTYLEVLPNRHYAIGVRR